MLHMSRISYKTVPKSCSWFRHIHLYAERNMKDTHPDVNSSYFWMSPLWVFTSSFCPSKFSLIICPFRHEKEKKHSYLNFCFKILVNYLGQACILSVAFSWFSSYQAKLLLLAKKVSWKSSHTLFILATLFPTSVFGVSCHEKIHFQLEIHL